MPLPLPTRLEATHAQFVDEHPPGADESVHMLQSVVDEVIRACTRPGDVVFDPFAGFGTTLARAVVLGREAVGIELLPERVEYIAARVPRALVIEGDARELLRLIEGHADAGIQLILCSPPYMTATHHDADPLMGYETDGGDYDRYLAELALVAGQCARAVTLGGYVVWNVADIHHMDHTTRLIHDCRELLRRHLSEVGTTEISWDRLPHDLVADALLIFQRQPSASDHLPDRRIAVRRGLALLKQGLGHPEWQPSVVQADGSRTMSWPIYPEPVMTALTAAIDAAGPDYEYLEHIDAVRQQPIRSAPVRDLSTWFTFVSRGERFSDGHIASFIRSGELQALFERLLELSAADETAG